MRLVTVYQSMQKRASEYGMTKEALNVGKALDTAGDAVRRFGDDVAAGWKKVFGRKPVPPTNPDKLIGDAFNSTKNVKTAPKTNSVGVPTEMDIVGNYKTRMTPDIRAMAEKVGEDPAVIEEIQKRLDKVKAANDGIVPSSIAGMDFYDHAPRYRAFMNKAHELTENERKLQEAIRKRNRPFASNGLELSPRLKADTKAVPVASTMTPQDIANGRVTHANQAAEHMADQAHDYLNRHPGQNLFNARMAGGAKPIDYILNPELAAEADFRRKLWGTGSLYDDMKNVGKKPISVDKMIENGTIK